MSAADFSPGSAGRQTEKRNRAISLGHDMRNAVADVISGLQLADLSGLDSESRNHLKAVRSAAMQLSRLGDEVLALALGEPLDTPSGEATHDLPAFLDLLAGRWPVTPEAAVKFRLDVHPDCPRWIGTDLTVLERVLVNLIGNAHKHTEKGHVTLQVALSDQEALKLTVSDTGPGFSNDALAMLFEPGGKPAQNAKPGTGLGLFIVRDLVTRIAGRITLQNRPGQGAEVSVTLPRSAWAPGRARLEPDLALPDLTGQRVLVAEDNLTNQLLMRQMVETLGATCSLVSDGLDATELLDKVSFDLALVDIEMPRLSGLDVIVHQRRKETAARTPPTQALPILAVTAFVLSANRDEIYQAGADGILAKPIMSLEAFGEAIAATLESRSDAIARDTDESDLLHRGVDTLALDRLLALAGEAHSAELLRRLQSDFQSVRSGIDKAARASDLSQLRARTHVLISLAGAVGHSCLQANAEKLNDGAHARQDPPPPEEVALVLDQIDEVLSTLKSAFQTHFAPEPE